MTVSADTKEGKGRVCVAIAGDTTQAVLRKALDVEAYCDVIEIRLDTIDKPDIKTIVSEITTDLLFTNRPFWEGGGYKGDEEGRIELLLEAVEAGCSFIDLELLAPDSSHARIREALAESSTRLILSNHDFERTPPASVLSEKITRMHEYGADIGKLITTAKGSEDVLRVLALQVEAGRLGMDLIAFCMGEAGVISRLATVDLGGFMTYCAADDEGGTASGQIPVKSYQKIRQLLP